MSEQARLVYLQEEIRHTRLAIRSSAGVLAWGIVLAILGFMLFSILAILAIIGVVLSISGGASYFYYIYRSEKLMQELREMAG